MRTRDIFRRAALLIEQGWCQGFYHSDGSYCILGAVSQVAVGTPGKLYKYIEFAGKSALLNERLKYAANTVMPIHEWNDDPARTKEDVLKALRKAARQAEGKTK